MVMGILCKSICESQIWLWLLIRSVAGGLIGRHESARGPTTTAKFNLMEPEELMNQEFNSDDWWVGDRTLVQI